MTEKVIETPTNRIEGTVLGQRIAAPKTYSPDILVPVPRSENRTQYGIEGFEFAGFDTWNMYEVSFLLNNGFPVTAVGKLIYPSWTDFIIESKSMKLYFNSFNMTHMGDTVEEAVVNFEKTVMRDLAERLTCDFHAVNFKLFFFEDQDKAVNPIEKEHTDLFSIVDYSSLEFTAFSEDPALLKEADPQPFQIYTNNIRSNCKITHQPDWAVIYIDFVPNDKGVDLSSLAQYLVSLRDESHFHEEVCEMVYKRLLDVYDPEMLHVTMLYTRRGGISICPQRATHESMLSYNLMEPYLLCTKTLHE